MSTKPPPDPTPIVAHCECCNLTEECTPEYVARTRNRCHGRWICGLCWEATKDEAFRSTGRPISTEEALRRHMAFCRKFRSAAPTDELMDVVVGLLRRRLGSPSKVDGVTGKFGRSGSCFSALAS